MIGVTAGQVTHRNIVVGSRWIDETSLILPCRGDPGQASCHHAPRYSVAHPLDPLL